MLLKLGEIQGCCRVGTNTKDETIYCPKIFHPAKNMILHFDKTDRNDSHKLNLSNVSDMTRKIK